MDSCAMRQKELLGAVFFQLQASVGFGARNLSLLNFPHLTGCFPEKMGYSDSQLDHKVLGRHKVRLEPKADMVVQSQIG